MGLPPNPVELDYRPSSKGKYHYRHTTCYRYGKCLDKAILKKWKDFSCEKCSVYGKFKKQSETFG